MLRLLALCNANEMLTSPNSGARVRAGLPPGGSTLSTSAPRSANNRVTASASPPARSSMRTESRSTAARVVNAAASRVIPTPRSTTPRIRTIDPIRCIRRQRQERYSDVHDCQPATSPGTHDASVIGCCPHGVGRSRQCRFGRCSPGPDQGSRALRPHRFRYRRLRDLPNPRRSSPCHQCRAAVVHSADRFHEQRGQSVVVLVERSKRRSRGFELHRFGERQGGQPAERDRKSGPRGVRIAWPYYFIGPPIAT